MPGPGLITGTKTLTSKAPALKAFVAATVRAMEEIAADPQKGLDATIRQVPELGSDKAGQLEILQATVKAWESDYTKAHGYGAIDQQAWKDAVTFMESLPEKVVAKPVSVDQLVSTDLVGP
jgi:ABC-type nitrate/sulfonate/bicarbonate transport system substrate-binding protein